MNSITKNQKMLNSGKKKIAYFFFSYPTGLVLVPCLKKKATQLSVISTNRFCLGETVEKDYETQHVRSLPKESNQKAKPCQKETELKFSITMPCTKILYHLLHII